MRDFRKKFKKYLKTLQTCRSVGSYASQMATLQFTPGTGRAGCREEEDSLRGTDTADEVDVIRTAVACERLTELGTGENDDAVSVFNLKPAHMLTHADGGTYAGMLMLACAHPATAAGVAEGTIIMTIVGYLSTTAMLMLIDCKYAVLAAPSRNGGHPLINHKNKLLGNPGSDEDSDSDIDTRDDHPMLPSDITYGDLGFYAFGPPGKRLVDVAVVVSQVGFCCGYLIYLCKNLSIYIPLLNQHQWLLLLLPPLYCLTLLRHLNKLAVFSLFAQVSNVFALAVVFWFDFSHSEKVPFVLKEASLKGLPFFFAVAIYCYEGAGLILSLEESVAESRRPRFRSIFVLTMVGLTVLYVCFGVSGYLSFGPRTEDIITLNLPHGRGTVDFAALVKICLGISLFFTYPMMLFPVSHLLDKTCGLHSTSSGNFMRLLVVCSTGLVVIAIPNFGVLISLIGATCCTLLAFILPALFHMRIFRARLTKRQRYFNWLLVGLGTLGSIVGLWDTFSRMGLDAEVTVDELSATAVGASNRNSSFSNVNHSLSFPLDITHGLHNLTNSSNGFEIPARAPLDGTQSLSLNGTSSSNTSDLSSQKLGYSSFAVLPVGSKSNSSLHATSNMSGGEANNSSLEPIKSDPVSEKEELSLEVSDRVTSKSTVREASSLRWITDTSDEAAAQRRQ